MDYGSRCPEFGSHYELDVFSPFISFLSLSISGASIVRPSRRGSTSGFQLSRVKNGGFAVQLEALNECTYFMSKTENTNLKGAGMSYLQKVKAGESQKFFKRIFFHFSAKILRQMRQMEKSREGFFFSSLFYFYFYFYGCQTFGFGRNLLGKTFLN